ncbi:EthD domain-containing protein [Sphingobium faniae]|nr:EthD domain-containing protein [Sphingobium faniae]
MKIVCLMRRKASLSHQQFKDYYENNHAHLAVELLPFFSEYRRNYLIKDEAYKPDHLDDVPPAPDYDVVTEISFASRDDYQRMVDALADPEIGGRIAADEENFLDRSAMVMFFVDEHVTAPEKLAHFFS